MADPTSEWGQNRRMWGDIWPLSSGMLGSHLSIAGGMHLALLKGEGLGLDGVQVFTKNQQQWKVKPLGDRVIAEWNVHRDRLGWQDRTVSHASYLINLASPDNALWKKSIDMMVVEIERCEALGIRRLVHHPGAFTSSTADEGLARIAEAYKVFLERTAGFRTILCLENTVGSGSNLGRTFDELGGLRARILELSPSPARVGFCFDTCHAHAGGYDMSTRASAEFVLALFDQFCGLDNLHVVHLNDSLGDLGSRRDRHAHIGQGTIGKGTSAKTLGGSGFAAMMNHPALAGVPKILETPKEDTEAGTPMDTINVRRLRRLIEGENPPNSGALLAR